MEILINKSLFNFFSKITFKNLIAYKNYNYYKRKNNSTYYINLCRKTSHAFSWTN